MQNFHHSWPNLIEAHIVYNPWCSHLCPISFVVNIENRNDLTFDDISTLKFSLLIQIINQSGTVWLTYSPKPQTFNTVPTIKLCVNATLETVIHEVLIVNKILQNSIYKYICRTLVISHITGLGLSWFTL